MSGLVSRSSMKLLKQNMSHPRACLYMHTGSTSRQPPPPAFSLATVAIDRKARLFRTPSATGDIHGDGASVTAIADDDEYFNDQFEYSGPSDRLVLTPLAIR